MGSPTKDVFLFSAYLNTPEMYAGSLLAFTTSVGKLFAPMDVLFRKALKKYRPAVVGDVTAKILRYSVVPSKNCPFVGSVSPTKVRGHLGRPSGPSVLSTGYGQLIFRF